MTSLTEVHGLARLRANRWQYVVLGIPLIRVILYVTRVAPGQIAETVLARWLQTIGLSLIGFGALIAIIGVYRAWAIVERAGLQLLWPICVVYTVVIVYADWQRAILYGVVYLFIAAASFARSVEITRAMRLLNKELIQQHNGDQP